MQTIQTLEKISRQLDPNEEERSFILQKTIAYINQYLNELPTYPGFGHGDFEKLSSMHIEENATPIETLLEVLQKEVDPVGISSASGKHLGFIPGGGL